VKATTNEFDLSPEEAQKLMVRRERNKAAAARCRKRRMDQISVLSDEVQVHEEKKMTLENTIAQLKAEKEHLEYILSQHQSECQLQIVSEHQQTAVPCIAVKSEPVLVETMELNSQIYFLEKPTTTTSAGRVLKPKRPLSLNIESAQIEAKKPTTMEGIVIDTPSNVLSSLGFDTLMTSTGLTPTSNIITPVSFNLSVPSCSSQQRSSEMMNLSELNTPATENVSLVSL